MHIVYAQVLEQLQKGQTAVLQTTCCSGSTDKTLLYSQRDAAFADHDGSSGQCIQLSENDDTLCLTERFFPKSRLIILGAGHIAVPLAKMGALLHFEITVFDDRLSFANRDRFPDAKDIICDYFANVTEKIAFCSNDFVAVVTRGHKYDYLCLQAILGGKIPRYFGMIGSKRRVSIILDQLQAEGHTLEKLKLLHAPIGLPIGAVTPEEISLAILAEMVQARRTSDTDHNIDQSEATDMHVLQWLAEEHAEKCAIVTVLSVKGSTPRGAGAKMLVFDDGRIIGSIGGGCSEANVIYEARRLLKVGGYARKIVDLTDAAEENGMVCGGIMDVLIEAAM